ncbi:MAG: right-handed parallel beta-helix repeat-containing protein [Bacteroidetes bacterium]|nr:right-handed parallel beta-helix repeat-containing protein [Bacteroidota bacterium]
MKFFIGILIVLSIAVDIFAKSDIHNQQNKTIIWRSDTILVSENIYVPVGTALVINPGTTIIFTGNYEIVVNGKIHAMGASGQPIVFTVSDTTGFADTTNNKGGWGRIRLLNNPIDTSYFFHCHFFYGKAYAEGINPANDMLKGGAIQAINYGSLIIEHSFFRHNKAKYAGAAVFIRNVQKTVIRNNQFTSNEALYEGGAISLNLTHFLIEGNYFSQNIAYNERETWYGTSRKGSGAAIHIHYNSTGNVLNNYFFNNKSVNGVVYETAPEIRIINNLIANNHGYGIVIGGYTLSTSKLINNTIVNNKSTAPGGSGILYYSPFLTMKNNIVSGNEFMVPGWPAVQIFTPENNTSSLSYSCIADPPVYYYGEGNIAGPPLFVNPTLGSGLGYDGSLADWSLLDNSPCVNAGTPDTTGLGLPATDLLGNPRIFGGRIDMGAIENQQVVVALPQNPLVNARVQVYPNPFRGSPRIVVNDASRLSSMELYNQKGQLMGKIELSMLNNGAIYELSKLPNGLYLLRTRFADGSIETTKLIKE